MSTPKELEHYLNKELGITISGTPGFEKHTMFTGGLFKIVQVALAAVATEGGVFAWLNPETADVFAVLFLDITTKTTGACTIDCGVEADAVSTSDTLLDGIDAGTAAAKFNSINAEKFDTVPKGNYITGSEASGAIAGIVGSAYIAWAPLATPTS